MPNLEQFPSAQAQETVPIQGKSSPPEKPSRKGLWSIAGRVTFALVVVMALAAGGLYILLSQGPVSSDRIRLEIESQLTALLGKNRTAKIGHAKIAIGKQGLLALDATDVKILKDDTVNLEVAREIAVKVHAYPLLRGELKAKSIIMSGASISLNTYFDATASGHLQASWPETRDFSAVLRSVRDSVVGFAQALDGTGLESIRLRNVNLVGFDQLGLRANRVG